MVARLAPKPLTDAKRRIEKVLSQKHRERFGTKAKVRVEDRGYKNYLNLFVTSDRFRGMLPTERALLVWKWLREGLSPRDHSRIAALLPLTPAESRRLPGNGR